MNIIALPERRLDFLWVRLALSGVLLALLIGPVRLAWYPDLHFHLSEAPRLIVTLAAVTLLAGPGLTTLIYRADKKGMRFDILVILALEILAIALAAVTLYERRPEFLVFAVDRFEAVYADEVTDHAFRFDEVADGEGIGPGLAIARFPDDDEERANLKYAIFFDGEPDIDRRPDQWYPYDSGADAVVARGRGLAQLMAAGAAYRRAVERWLGTVHGVADDYVFLPVSGKIRDGAMIVERSTGRPAGMIDVDPWI